ncbi:MAG: hypothetical protein MUD08_05785 [Cytophagales bacterium]|nr:hypothetical protein [Cytophagales bacterium]
MKLFVDTNIWVYRSNPTSAFRLAARQKLVDLMTYGHQLHISTQTLRNTPKPVRLWALAIRSLPKTCG